MIDPGLLTPAAPTHAKAGLGVLSATPQAAKAFAEEFGSALRTMNQKASKSPGERRHSPPGASVSRTPEQTPTGTDRVAGDRKDTPMKVRDTRPSVSTNTAERPQAEDRTSNDFQPEISAEHTVDAPVVEDSTAQGELPQADASVDALKTLLTMGALASVDTGHVPTPPMTDLTGTVSPDADLAGEVTQTTDVPSPNRDAGFEADPATDQPVGPEAADGLAPPTGQTMPAETNAPTADMHAPTNLGEAPLADTTSTTAQPREPAEAAETTMVAGVQGHPAPAPAPTHDQPAVPYPQGDRDVAAAHNESPVQSAPVTVIDGTDVAQPPATESVQTPDPADAGTVTESSDTAESALSESPDPGQAESNTEQGDQPLPQYNQPTQPTASKADTSSAQALISGVQSPGQATTMTGTTAASAPQHQQPGQPVQPPTLTPAQQLASAMGALRRRGDGSYLTEISLNPKELGQVRLQVHVAGTTVSLQATALDPATRALLAAGLDDLSQALTDAGLERGHLDVSQGDGQTGDGTEQDQPFPGFGVNGVQVIEEEALTMATEPADYITSTSVNTLA